MNSTQDDWPAPPVNEGWGVPANPVPAPAKQVSFDTTSYHSVESASPHSSSRAAYVDWQPVAYQKTAVVKSNNELLEEAFKAKNERRGGARMLGNNQRSLSGGGGGLDSSLQGQQSGGYRTGQQDSGWGSKSRDTPPHSDADFGGRRGSDGHSGVRYGDDGGYSGGNGFDNSSWGSNDCYNCDQPGHMSRDCTEPRRGGNSNSECYNCNSVGHFSRECPEPQRGSRASGLCYNCQGKGHMSRDCPEPRTGGNSSSVCYNCDRVGHFSRECPQPRRGGGCHFCGNSGHQSRDCDLQGFGADAIPASTQASDSWGQPYQSPQTTTGWRESESAPTNEPRAMNIHPDRLRLMGGEPAAGPSRGSSSQPLQLRNPPSEPRQSWPERQNHNGFGNGSGSGFDYDGRVGGAGQASGLLPTSDDDTGGW